jgi:hypothetical protein
MPIRKYKPEQIVTLASVRLTRIPETTTRSHLPSLQPPAILTRLINMELFVMPSIFRPCLAIFAAALLAPPPPSFAFDTPLSDQAVREAYFLGQRHDGSMVRLLDKYTKYLPQPKSGPHISSITFFTPFALAAQLSSEHTSGYSAQQAALDHRAQQEFVRILVQISFTDSYGPFIARPTGSRSGSPTGYVPRPFDFWKDFDVQVFGEDKKIKHFSSSGQPIYVCSNDGGCTLTGATLQFEFPADAFISDSATVDVTPPEGDPVTVNFDLTSLR